MKTKSLCILVILISFGLGFYLAYSYLKDNSKPYQEKRYITTFIKVPEPYPVPKPYPVPTKPIEVKTYEKDSSAIDSLKLLLSEKDIIIQGLKGSQISVSQDFLKQFPLNPKLLELRLERDSLSVSLLDIQGIPSCNTYPLYLDRYRYKWVYNSLSNESYDPIPMEKIPPWGYSVGGGFDILQRNIYSSFRVELLKNPWTIYSDLRLGIIYPKKSTLNLGFEYSFSRYGSNRK